MPRVLWAAKPKTGLGFEIGPSYDDVPTMSQFLIDGQSSCIFFVLLFLLFWIVSVVFSL